MHVKAKLLHNKQISQLYYIIISIIIRVSSSSVVLHAHLPSLLPFFSKKETTRIYFQKVRTQMLSPYVNCLSCCYLTLNTALEIFFTYDSLKKVLANKEIFKIALHIGLVEH